MKVMNFQEKTSERILEIFRQQQAGGGQKRVLLSDEVGLGKTIMARDVIDKVRELRRDLGDDYFRIVYVCSNQNIIQQNINKLVDNPDDVLKISDSRLSMQHLVLEERMAKVRATGEYGEGKMPTLLVPLTPATSFSVQGGSGSKYERALMYALVRRLSDMDTYQESLYDLFRLNVKPKYWKNDVAWYESRVVACGEEYITNMTATLEVSVPDSLRDKLTKGGWNWNESVEIINSLRTIFAEISLRKLEPDLVVMDEFQRFSDLLSVGDNTEESMIAHKFFSDENISYVLLLSATPYKPFTTLEELNEQNCDEQYEDFLRLMRFLNNGESEFQTVWEDYSSELAQISTDNMEVLIAKKKRAEDSMYSVMCRTERFGESLIKSMPGMEKLPVSEGDVLSYCQMQHLMDATRDVLGENATGCNISIEYVKSSPYLLSFMQHYQQKKLVESAFNPDKKNPVALPINQQTQRLLLKGNRVWGFKDLQANNARLDYIKSMLFDKHSERLLWVPASHPYYDVPTDNVFAQNKDFSKVLVFSSWEMVPRMLAVMLSYESEQRTIPAAFPGTSYLAKTGGNRLKNDKNEHQRDIEVLCYASETLASLYNPEAYFREGTRSISDIEVSVAQKITERLSTIATSTDAPTGSEGILLLAKALDGDDVIAPVPTERAVRILTHMAIASPAICLLRIMKDPSVAAHLASHFVSMFNRRESAAIIDLCSKLEPANYYERVLEYCVMGNLQSVMDEFAHMQPNPNRLQRMIEDAFIGVSSLDIDTTDSFCKSKQEAYHKKASMRRSYAYDYANAKAITDKTMEHNGNLQQAFNSPFRPFVLATTSVGQEGLDFHWYSRKIVHWNLPSNPVDMEQREGRINRFKCLAIRRNVAHLFSEHFAWDDIFHAAETAWKEQYAERNYSQMVPYWCLPPEVIREHADDGKLEMIERIVPMYPMSTDQLRYKHLIDVLSLYRLTMGQPRQEELLEMLASSGLSNEDIQKLLINLSPYEKSK